MTDTNNSTKGEQLENTQAEGNGVPSGKTFTQDEVNRIIGDRLSKEKSKSDTEYSKREQELLEREMNITAVEVLTEHGLPKELASVLKYSDKASLVKAIEFIEKWRDENVVKAKGNFKIIENRLPTGNAYEYEDDPLKKAFALK